MGQIMELMSEVIDCNLHTGALNIAETHRGGEYSHGPDRLRCFQNTGRGWWNEGDIAETLRTPCGGDSMKANVIMVTI